MPITVRKLPNKELYRVTNTKTGKVHAYGTTKANATKQARLLTSIDKKKRSK